MRLPIVARRGRQQGFTLLETMIAIVVLMIGLLALLATFALAIGNTQSVQLDAVARQKAREAMESIYTARQTSQISFDAIQNVGNGGGIFTAGFTPMTDPGPDGLEGTADDVPAAPIRLPGASGTITGTNQDQLVELSSFSRQIAITNIANEPNLRQITISVKYLVPQGWYKTYQIQALVSAYR
jgi:type II secretory pathway pseudopilin PulG